MRWLSRHLAACLVMLCIAAVVPSPMAMAQTCVPGDYASVVDETGAALRTLNEDSERDFQNKIGALATSRGWDDIELASQTNAILSKPELEQLDDQISELFSAVETLGNLGASEAADCRRLDEIKLKAELLIESMRAKSRAMIGLVDEAGRPKATAQAKAPAQQPSGQPAAKVAAAPAKPKTSAPTGAKPINPPAATDPGWSVATVPAPDYQPPAPAADGTPLAATDGTTIVIRPGSNPDVYSVEDIQEAGRGFFGNISAGLASVINYAFQHAGQPNGYILGTEGGGAFIAGLRYGKGTLHLKNGLKQKIYWRGPSLGYDFGAEGSRTMFLVYNARTDADAMGRFTGVDGSAYLVGGVGITFLRSGDVVMAPIRTGLGLRLGANIGYLKFSRKAGWNPF